MKIAANLLVNKTDDTAGDTFEWFVGGPGQVDLSGVIDGATVTLYIATDLNCLLVNV